MDGQLRAPALNQTPSFFSPRLSAAFQKELHKFMKLVSVLQIIVRKLRRAHVSMETPPAQLRAESERWFGLSAVTEPWKITGITHLMGFDHNNPRERERERLTDSGIETSELWFQLSDREMLLLFCVWYVIMYCKKVIRWAHYGTLMYMSGFH